jgi:uncharacterized protein YkwD
MEPKKVVDAINKEREKRGMDPLSLFPALMRSAQGHSNEMAEHNQLSHVGIDGSDPFTRMKKEGYAFTKAGECVAYGQKDESTVVDDWMNYRGHREIILDSSFAHLGVGESNTYWTADFAVGMPNILDFDLW